jgi:hypothetical protein
MTDMKIERISVRGSAETGIGGIMVENDGAVLVSTNYWQTDHCAKGLFYMTTNAGCVRLLVPPVKEGDISEMTRGVREVVLTRGRLEGIDCVEIMFEDGSNSPFAIHMQATLADRLWPPRDEAKPWRFAIYTRSGKVAEYVCYLRRAPLLPHMRSRG